MKHWSVLRGVFMRDLLAFRRYAFNTVSGVITLYLAFLFIFYGVRALVGLSATASAQSRAETVVWYFVWSMAIFTFSDLSWSLTNEAQVGTLEQLYLCPLGFTYVNACQLLASLLINLLVGAAMLVLTMATTGSWLHIDLVTVVPLILATLGGAYGIGFAMGGLALVFKRVQAFFQVMQFVFMGFLLLPWDKAPWARYLPLAMGSHLLRQAMVDGLRIWELRPGDLAMLVVTAVGYIGLGLLAFGRAERVARDRGLLGQY